MNQGLTRRYPNVVKVAEDSTSYLKVTAPVQYDGLGFDYKWDMADERYARVFRNGSAVPFKRNRQAYLEHAVFLF